MCQYVKQLSEPVFSKPPMHIFTKPCTGNCSIQSTMYFIIRENRKLFFIWFLALHCN